MSVQNKKLEENSMRRRKMSRQGSRRSFKRGKKFNRKNIALPYRGGIRL